MGSLSCLIVMIVYKKLKDIIMKDKTIVFNIGEENKPVYEDLAKFDVMESSYFSDQYKKG